MTVRSVFWGVSNIEMLKEEYPAHLYMACILGPDYPTTEAVTYYDFDAYSTSTPDDDEVVKPQWSAFNTSGRWLKIDPAGAVQINSDWNASTGPAVILNKPSLSTVSSSGSYNDLTGKPSLATVATSGSYTDLSNKPTLATVASSGSYNDLTSKPTIPTVPVQYQTRAQTNTSGVYTWTFPTAFGSGVIPVIECTVEDSSAASWNHQITAISNTAMTTQLVKTTAVTILGISVLGVSATPQAYVHLTARAP